MKHGVLIIQFAFFYLSLVTTLVKHNTSCQEQKSTSGKWLCGKASQIKIDSGAMEPWSHGQIYRNALKVIIHGNTLHPSQCLRALNV
mmetsp:Transcript_21778/g.33235  ORF Transcript_21778/g.33235 Transcript_21778/m.33235 type:complete len:87 (+) Transcript_21778:744-1004(+)